MNLRCQSGHRGTESGELIQISVGHGRPRAALAHRMAPIRCRWPHDAMPKWREEGGDAAALFHSHSLTLPLSLSLSSS